MKAARFEQVGGDLHMVDLPVPTPGPNQVRIKVSACGICHSDAIAKYDGMKGGFPRIPGHEVAGVVDAVGEGVTTFQIGQRVGAGWFGGGHCGHCNSCKSNAWISCAKSIPTGIGRDGGYAYYMIAEESAVARIPDELKLEDAAPLLCAGITTFNALRNGPARAGDVVGVVGLGGLGHLAVQFASKMGFRTVGISRGKDKEEFAKKLGAHHYIDSTSQNVAEELNKLGGAKVVLVTAPSKDAIEPLVGGMALGGQICLLAAIMEPSPVNTLALLSKRLSITGWSSGDARDSEDTLKFAAMTGVRPMIELFPLEKANEAFQRMITNQARFRVVLQIQ